MSFVATVIPWGESLESVLKSKFETLLESLKVKIIDIKELSHERVYDYSIVIEEGNTSSNNIDENVLIVKKALFEFSTDEKIDIVFQKKETRSNKKLFVFDMDSTLIEQEVIEMIAAYANVEPEVAKITSLAMNGEIDFTESLKRRVALLKGIKSNIFEELKPKLRITKGAVELTSFLHENGVKLAVLSGGFIPLANFIKEKLNLDYAFANTLEVLPGETTLNGTVTGEIVDGKKKAELLERIANQENIALQNVVAVGDGANDLPMMAKAGFGVAFCAKPTVQAQAPSRLNSGSLRDIMYILGYSD